MASGAFITAGQYFSPLINAINHHTCADILTCARIISTLTAPCVKKRNLNFLRRIVSPQMKFSVLDGRRYSLSLSLSLSFMGNILLIMSSHTCTGTFRSDSTHTSASTISREIKFESSPDSHARSSGARRDSRAGVLLQTNIFLLACPTKHGMSLTRALGAHAPRRPVENRDIRHTARERGVSGTSRVHAITRILSRGVYYYTRLSPDYWKK